MMPLVQGVRWLICALFFLVQPVQAESRAVASGSQSGAESSDAGLPPRRLSDRAELERIIEMYMAGDYEQCSAQLNSFLDFDKGGSFQDVRVIEKARLYYSTCTLMLGDRQRARSSLLVALQENPLMPSPDSLTFPPPLVSLFLEVRDEVQQLISEREREQVAQLRRENEAARRAAEARLLRERALEELATEERVVAKNSRYLAAVPLGVGQFQNGRKSLGAVFLVSEGLLAATALTSGIALNVLTTRARNQGCTTRGCVSRYNNQKDSAHLTLTWSTWGLIGVAALGIAEAQWHFRPERQLDVRKRELPENLQKKTDAPHSSDARSAGDSSDARSAGADAQAWGSGSDDLSARRDRKNKYWPLVAVTQAGAMVGLAGKF